MIKEKNKTQRMTKVICIGSALQDVFMPTGDGIVTATPEDKTARHKITFELGAKYRIEDRFTATGGCALNVALGLAHLGVAAAPYALIGGDATGAWIRETVARYGADTGLLRQVSETQSDLSFILVDRKSGERVIFTNRDLQEKLVIDSTAISGGNVLFLGSLAANFSQNAKVVLRVVEQCGCPLVYNPSQDNIAHETDIVRELVAHATHLFVNDDEATAIVLAAGGDRGRVDDHRYLLTTLASMGPSTVVMTAGSEGATMLHHGRTYHAPAQGGRPVETTGAGDAFTSGTLAALLSGHDPRTAMAWGAVNAGSVVQHYGATAGLVPLADMRRRADAVMHHVTGG